MALTLDEFTQEANEAWEICCPSMSLGVLIEANKRKFNNEIDRLCPEEEPKEKEDII